MKKLIILTTPLILMLGFMAQAYAQSTQENRILLVEIQPGSVNSATEEFVELYNTGFSGQNLDDWRIQYKSAGGTNWLTKAELSGYIAPGGRYVAATFTSEDNSTQSNLTSGMAQGGGHIRLIDDSEKEIDLIGWGDAIEPLVLAAPSFDKEFSLKRRVDEDGYFYVDDNNFEDWFISEDPSPQGDAWKPAQTSTKPDGGSTTQPSNPTTPKPVSTKPSGGGTDSSTSQNRSNYKINITEFLPDPESPQKDADDEFIELYNPNNSAVNLEGYTLESGSEYRYSFTIPKVTIAAHAYLALFSIDTGLTLPNSGSQVRLLSPAGLVLSEFVYDESEAGQSWAVKSDGTWSMTTTPTPNAANSFGGAQNTTEATGSQESTSQLSDNAVSLSTGSVLGDGSENSTNTTDDKSPARKMNSIILAGVGLLAVLYAVYEYRHDIGNRIEQLRRYIKNRRENRRQA